MQHPLPRIAIIGTGIAGLACAAQLHAHAAVSLFDKSRGLGGRMATRRSEVARFDHGVSRFSADGDFEAFLQPLIAAGSVAAWSPKTVRLSPQAGINQPRYAALPPRRQWVASPGMSSLGRAVVAQYQFDAVHLGVTVSALETQPDQRMRLLADGQVYEDFDRVIIAMPPAQAAALLPHGAMRQACESVVMQPCHTLMLAAPTPTEVAWDIALVDDPMVEIVIANHQKPGRDGSSAFVVQTNHQWSAQHIDQPVADVGQLIQARLFELFADSLAIEPLRDPESLAYQSCHRWLYAAAATPLQNPQGFLFDAASGLGVAGDWCLGTRVRHGFASGTALGASVKKSL